MKQLRSLVCGNVPRRPTGGYTDDFMQVIDGLGALVEDYGRFVKRFKTHPTQSLSSYFAPQAARSMMEASCSVLIARLDPMRVIYSAKAQSSPAYDRGRQQNSGIRWKGDILASEFQLQAPNRTSTTMGAVVTSGNTAAAAATVANTTTSPSALRSVPAAAGAQSTTSSTKGKDIWDPKIEPTKIPRSLMSLQFFEIVWMPALQTLTDWQAHSGKSSTWLAELISIAPEDISHDLPATGHRIYSELSKGIHPEFIVQRQTIFDDVTLQTLMTQTVAWTAKVAFLSHFSHVTHLPHAQNRAFDMFAQLEAAIA